MKKIINMILFTVVCLMLGLPVHAENEEDYGFGNFVKAEGKTNILSEYDYEKESDVESSYKLAPDVKWRGVSGLKDIVPGDYIEVTFIEKGTDKVTVSILVDKEPEITEEESEI